MTFVEVMQMVGVLSLILYIGVYFLDKDDK